MARKQFVSSKKNAPSRAVSSKEAALHGRAGGGAIGAENDDEEDGDDDDDDDDDGDSDSNSPGSPASSDGSSLLTSDEPDDAADELDSGAAAVATPPVAVEVVPASVGRGKQLRFPTVISRGKESRVFGRDSDDDDSDSDDSLLSIASDEEEDEDKSSVEGQPKRQSSKHKTNGGGGGGGDGEEEDAGAPAYPIKAFRARKRHRPDSGYYNQMSTYVRDCLLSVRDGAESADVLSEEAHDEFRRKLSAGAVERVAWKEATPPATEQSAEPVQSAGSEKKKKRKAEAPAEQVKKEKPRKESRKIKSEPTSTSKTSTVSTIPTSTSSTSTNTSSSTTSTSTGNNGNSSSNGATMKVEAVKASPPDPVLCSSCKRKLSDVAKEPEKPPPAPKKSVTIVVPEVKVESKPAVESRPAAESKAPALEPQGTFLIPTVGGRDVRRLRAEADRLNEEARALKHEGNHKGKTESGPAGQIAQGKFYLRSSAKFFQNALKLADIKAAYKDLGDEGHARRYGDFCVTTLTQTSSLIESTIRTFQAAGSKRMMALAYKLSSIVHLTIYRLQHTRLLMYYSDLFTPGRSPETRQNGAPTPPIAGATPDSREAAMRSYLLKEMDHTLRGFEMWRRYEACNVVVLPRISNPATTDLAVLFEELTSELGQA